MDENEVLENDEVIENEITSDNSEILSEINDNLITINSNITTTYDAIISLQEENTNTQTILNNCFGGLQLISSLTVLLIIGAFIVLVARYIKRFL